MDFFNGKRKEINEAFRIMSHRNEKAMEEIYGIMVCLRHNHFPIEWHGTPMVFLHNEKTNKFEIVYDNLESETLEFMSKYFEDVLTTKVDNVETWIENQKLKINWR